MTDNNTITRIRAGLTSSSRAVRAESVDALASLGDAGGLLRGIRSPDPYVRARSAQALGAVRGVRVTFRLVRAMFDAHAEVRCAVARSLAQRGGWAMVRALGHLAADENAAVRYAALKGLAQLGRPDAEACLRSAANTDSEPWVRESVAAVVRDCRRAARPEGRVARR